MSNKGKKIKRNQRPKENLALKNPMMNKRSPKRPGQMKKKQRPKENMALKNLRVKKSSPTLNLTRLENLFPIG